MANLEIAQIQNAALKAAALEVDESGKKDGYIDSSEINIFTDKAIALLNEKKCTAQEFATLFATNEVDKNSATDVFAKDAEEAKRAEKLEKTIAIKKDIEQKEEKLQILNQIYIETTPDVIMGDIGALTAGIGALSAAPALVKGGAYLGGFITKGITGMVMGGLCGTICTAALVIGSAILVGKACQQIFASKEDKQQLQKADELYKNEILPLNKEINELKAQLTELLNS